jgi:tryptophanyl-tRNA synthetase
LARENAKDIIACGAWSSCFVAATAAEAACTGFDRRRTFIFSDFAYMGGEFYKNCIRIAKVRCVDSAGLQACVSGLVRADSVST